MGNIGPIDFAEWLAEKLRSGELLQEFDESLVGTGSQNDIDEDDLDVLSQFTVELSTIVQKAGEDFIGDYIDENPNEAGTAEDFESDYIDEHPDEYEF